MARSSSVRLLGRGAVRPCSRVRGARRRCRLAQSALATGTGPSPDSFRTPACRCRSHQLHRRRAASLSLDCRCTSDRRPAYIPSACWAHHRSVLDRRPRLDRPAALTRRWRRRATERPGHRRCMQGKRWSGAALDVAQSSWSPLHDLLTPAHGARHDPAGRSLNHHEGTPDSAELSRSSQPAARACRTSASNTELFAQRRTRPLVHRAEVAAHRDFRDGLRTGRLMLTWSLTLTCH